MEQLLFVWDTAKAAENERKHGVTFREGATVFRDSSVVRIADPDHSEVEERFVALGYSKQSRLLVVVFTERGETIRIISCRQATKRERRIYEEAEV